MTKQEQLDEARYVLIMAREQLYELYKNSAGVEWSDVDAIDAINQWLDATQEQP